MNSPAQQAPARIQLLVEDGGAVPRPGGGVAIAVEAQEPLFLYVVQGAGDEAELLHGTDARLEPGARLRVPAEGWLRPTGRVLCVVAAPAALPPSLWARYNPFGDDPEQGKGDPPPGTLGGSSNRRRPAEPAPERYETMLRVPIDEAGAGGGGDGDARTAPGG